jgi:hypothetical protein
MSVCHRKVECLLLAMPTLWMIEVGRLNLVDIGHHKVSSDVRRSRRSILVIAKLSSVENSTGAPRKVLGPVVAWLATVNCTDQQRSMSTSVDCPCQDRTIARSGNKMESDHSIKTVQAKGAAVSHAGGGKIPYAYPNP